MKKNKRNPVEVQELDEIGGKTNSYERYAEDKGENVLGNPDILPEISEGPSSPQLLMGEAIEHLQGRQREVYIAIMRDGKTQEETGEMLGISRAAVRTYLDRAISFISGYCKKAMENGRI